MLNPMNNNSQKIVDQTANNYHFSSQVYAHKDQFMNQKNLQKELPKHPKTMFLPSESLMRLMVDANI